MNRCVGAAHPPAYRYAATEGNIALMNIHEIGKPGLGAVGRVGLLLRTAMGLTFIKVRTRQPQAKQ